MLRRSNIKALMILFRLSIMFRQLLMLHFFLHQMCLHIKHTLLSHRTTFSPIMVAIIRGIILKEIITIAHAIIDTIIMVEIVTFDLQTPDLCLVKFVKILVILPLIAPIAWIQIFKEEFLILSLQCMPLPTLHLLLHGCLILVLAHTWQTTSTIFKILNLTLVLTKYTLEMVKVCQFFTQALIHLKHFMLHFF